MEDMHSVASYGVTQINHFAGFQQLRFERRVTELIVRWYAEILVLVHTQILVDAGWIFQFDFVVVHVCVDQRTGNGETDQRSASIPIGRVLFGADITILQSGDEAKELN